MGKADFKDGVGINLSFVSEKVKMKDNRSQMETSFRENYRTSPSLW